MKEQLRQDLLEHKLVITESNELYLEQRLLLCFQIPMESS